MEIKILEIYLNQPIFLITEDNKKEILYCAIPIKDKKIVNWAVATDQVSCSCVYKNNKNIEDIRLAMAKKLKRYN